SIQDFCAGHVKKLYQLFCSTSGTRRSSVSVCSAFSRALSHAAFSSDTAAETTTLPSTRISNWLEVVWPISAAPTPHFTATSWIRWSFSGSQEITTRLASSPNRTYSAARPLDSKSSSAPTSRGNPDSATATAKPPSEQSCADSISPCSASSIRQFCSAASFFSSRAGGKPHS